MSTLSLSETQRHLDKLIAAAPEHLSQSKADSFITLLNRIQNLISEESSPDLPVTLYRNILFPSAQPRSQSTLFSRFRNSLSKLAEQTGSTLTLVQPDLRGKDPTEVRCHFEGSPISTHPELNTIALNSTAGLDRQTLI